MIQIRHYETVTKMIKYKLENNQRKQNNLIVLFRAVSKNLVIAVLAGKATSVLFERYLVLLKYQPG